METEKAPDFMESILLIVKIWLVQTKMTFYLLILPVWKEKTARKKLRSTFYFERFTGSFRQNVHSTGRNVERIYNS